MDHIKNHCCPSLELRIILNAYPKGPFINDVTQLGGRGGSLLCDSLNRVVSKMTILV